MKKHDSLLTIAASDIRGVWFDGNRTVVVFAFGERIHVQKDNRGQAEKAYDLARCAMMYGAPEEESGLVEF